MRNAKLFAVALSLSLTAFAGCGGENADAPKPASEVSSEDQPTPFLSPPGFACRIRMPGSPIQKVETNDLPDGGKMKSVTITSQDAPGQATCVVAYNEFPEATIKSMGSVDEALDRAAEGLVSPYKGKIDKIDPVTVSGSPGRAFTFKATDPVASVTAKIVLRGNRLYQISYLTPMSNKAERAKAYVDSFEFTDGK